MTTPDREELERLAKAATAGPWYQTGTPWFRDGSGVLCGSPDGNVAFMVADCESWIGGRDEYRENNPLYEVADADADAAFIAAANPATILTLLSQLDEAERVLGEIARQKKTDELDTEYDVEVASFEDGYDLCIDRARAALPTPPKEGTSHER